MLCILILISTFGYIIYESEQTKQEASYDFCNNNIDMNRYAESKMQTFGIEWKYAERIDDLIECENDIGMNTTIWNHTQYKKDDFKLCVNTRFIKKSIL